MEQPSTLPPKSAKITEDERLNWLWAMIILALVYGVLTLISAGFSLNRSITEVGIIIGAAIALIGVSQYAATESKEHPRTELQHQKIRRIFLLMHRIACLLLIAGSLLCIFTLIASASKKQIDPDIVKKVTTKAIEYRHQNISDNDVCWQYGITLDRFNHFADSTLNLLLDSNHITGNDTVSYHSKVDSALALVVDSMRSHRILYDKLVAEIEALHLSGEPANVSALLATWQISANDTVYKRRESINFPDMQIGSYLREVARGRIKQTKLLVPPPFNEGKLTINKLIIQQ